MTYVDITDQVSADRLARRREHLMTETLLTEHPAQRPAWAPAPMRGGRGPWGARRLVPMALAAGVLAAGVFAATSFTGGPHGNGPEALALERVNATTMRIRVVDDAASAKEMTRELHDAGFKITVETMPASPQVVGRWVAALVDDHDDAREHAITEQLSSQLGAGGVEAIEVTTPGPRWEQTLYLGVKPAPGEAVNASGEVNAASPGGLLYCYRLSGADPATAEKRLVDAGYTVHWRAQNDTMTRAQRDAAAAASTPPAGKVVRAVVQPDQMPEAGPKDVYLTVTPETDAHYPVGLWEGYGSTARTTGVRDYASCPAS